MYQHHAQVAIALFGDPTKATCLSGAVLPAGEPEPGSKRSPPFEQMDTWYASDKRCGNSDPNPLDTQQGLHICISVSIGCKCMIYPLQSLF